MELWCVGSEVVGVESLEPGGLCWLTVWLRKLDQSCSSVTQSSGEIRSHDATNTKPSDKNLLLMVAPTE